MANLTSLTCLSNNLPPKKQLDLRTSGWCWNQHGDDQPQENPNYAWKVGQMWKEVSVFLKTICLWTMKYHNCGGDVSHRNEKSGNTQFLPRKCHRLVQQHEYKTYWSCTLVTWHILSVHLVNTLTSVVLTTTIAFILLSHPSTIGFAS